MGRMFNVFFIAYCMGSLNSDCWYIVHCTLKDFSRPITSEPDQTIEM